MSVRLRPTLVGGRLRRRDLVVIWFLIAIGILAVIVSTGYMFGEGLRAYIVCNEAPRTGCSDLGGLGSLGLSFVGGVVVVAVGGILGLRRYRDGRDGTWLPLISLGGVAAVTVFAVLFLRIATAS